MRALVYDKNTGEVLGGLEASLKDDLLAYESGDVGVIISAAEWRESAVDISNPKKPKVIKKAPTE